LAGPDGTPPPGVVGAPADEGDPIVVIDDSYLVTTGPGPGREMHLEVRISALHAERGAGAEAGQGPFDQDGGAAVEAQVLKVDSRIQR
jgi:hypothetical protein